MKRGLAVILAAVMLVSLSLTAYAAGDKAMEKIDFLKQTGLVKGDEKGDLKLDDPITRAEIATLLAKIKVMDGLDKRTFKGIFKDVPESHWAWKFIEAVSEASMVKGVSEGEFAPLKKVKYAEAMAMLVRMNEEWKDENVEWPKGYVDGAEKFGLLEDVKIDNVMSEAKRKDVFVMIYNQMNREKPIPVETSSSDDSYLKDFKAFVASIDVSVFEREGIAAGNDAQKQKRIDTFMAEYKKAKELSEVAKPTAEQLKEMQDMYKLEKGKVRGSLKDLGKKVMVQMTVEGERGIKTAGDKTYTALTDNTIIVKTPYKGLEKSDDKAKLYLNFVLNADYTPKADAISNATPKYKKMELPKESYTVEAVDGGYKIKVLKFPEGVAILKPVIKVKFAEGAYVENGDLVFVVGK